jgi:hypothetical protein
VKSFAQTRSAAVSIAQGSAGSLSPDGREGLRRTGAPLGRAPEPLRTDFA